MESTLPTTSYDTFPGIGVNIVCLPLGKNGYLESPSVRTRSGEIKFHPHTTKGMVYLDEKEKKKKGSPMSCAPPRVVCEIEGHCTIPLQDVSPSVLPTVDDFP